MIMRVSAFGDAVLLLVQQEWQSKWTIMLMHWR